MFSKMSPKPAKPSKPPPGPPGPRRSPSPRSPTLSVHRSTGRGPVTARSGGLALLVEVGAQVRPGSLVEAERRESGLDVRLAAADDLAHERPERAAQLDVMHRALLGLQRNLHDRHVVRRVHVQQRHPIERFDSRTAGGPVREHPAERRARP